MLELNLYFHIYMKQGPFAAKPVSTLTLTKFSQAFGFPASTDEQSPDDSNLFDT